MTILRFKETKSCELLLESILKGVGYNFLNNRCLDLFEYTRCNSGYNVFEIQCSHSNQKETFKKLIDYCNKKDLCYLKSKFNDSVLITGIFTRQLN